MRSTYFYIFMYAQMCACVWVHSNKCIVICMHCFMWIFPYTLEVQDTIHFYIVYRSMFVYVLCIMPIYVCLYMFCALCLSIDANVDAFNMHVLEIQGTICLLQCICVLHDIYASIHICIYIFARSDAPLSSVSVMHYSHVLIFIFTCTCVLIYIYVHILILQIHKIAPRAWAVVFQIT